MCGYANAQQHVQHVLEVIDTMLIVVRTMYDSQSTLPRPNAQLEGVAVHSRTVNEMQECEDWLGSREMCKILRARALSRTADVFQEV